MITEHSLRAALLEQALAAAPVSVDAVTAGRSVTGGFLATALSTDDAGEVSERRPGARGASRSRRRARFTAVTVGAAATGLVAATVVTVVSTQGTPAGTAPAAASGRSTGFEPVYWNLVKPVSGLVVASRTLRADRQTVLFGARSPVDISSPGSSSATHGSGRSEGSSANAVQQVARVDLHAVGTFDAAAVLTGTKVDLAGRVGYRASIPVREHDDAPDSVATVPVVAWQWAANSWAVAAGFDAAHQSVDAETQLAESIVPDATPVRLPAAFTTLPAGLQRTSLTIDESVSTTRTYSATFDRSSDTTPSSADHAIADPDYVLTMTLSDANRTAADPPATGTRPSADPTTPVLQAGIVAGGVTYTVSTVRLPGFTTVYVSGPGSPLAVQLDVNDRISKGIDPQWAQFTPAPSWTDQNTWPAASEALP